MPKTARDCFQVKYGQRQPSYLRAWLNGIRGTAHERGRVGVVVWKARRARSVRPSCSFAYEDWQALHGASPVEE